MKATPVWHLYDATTGHELAGVPSEQLAWRLAEGETVTCFRKDCVWHVATRRVGMAGDVLVRIRGVRSERSSSGPPARTVGRPFSRQLSEDAELALVQLYHRETCSITWLADYLDDVEEQAKTALIELRAASYVVPTGYVGTYQITETGRRRALVALGEVARGR